MNDTLRATHEAAMQQMRVTTAACDLLGWINTEADIPEGYSYSLHKPGPKNQRVVMHPRGGGDSVAFFIDRNTGDVLMAAGWKTPAKGVRANVFDLDDIKSRFTWSCGWLYMR
jgi:hypothetical protein